MTAVEHAALVARLAALGAELAQVAARLAAATAANDAPAFVNVASMIGAPSTRAARDWCTRHDVPQTRGLALRADVEAALEKSAKRSKAPAVDLDDDALIARGLRRAG